MKKILLIIPFAICLVLSSIPSFTVAAEASNYCSFPEFLERYPEASTKSQYFFFNYAQKLDNTDDWFYYHSYFIHPLGSVEVSKDPNGLFVFHCDQGFICGHVYNSNFGSFGQSSNINDQFSSEFKFDPKSNTFYSSHLGDPVTAVNAKTTFVDATYDLGDLYVEFEPELKGVVDYNIEIGGKKYLSSGLNLFIKNKSDSFYQFAIFILNEGENVFYRHYYLDDTVVDGFDYTTSGLFYSNKPVFAYVKNIWFETMINGSRTKVNAASAWHGLASGRDVNDSIYWSQIKLEQGHNYDIVVVACPVDSFDDTESNCVRSYVGDPCFISDNVSYPSVIYRSSFRVTSNTHFDSTTKSDTGSFAYDPDGNINDLFDNIEGYYDKDNQLVLTSTGTKFSNFSFDGSFNNSSGGSSGNSFDYSNTFKAEGTYRDLLSNSRLFFTFLASVLGYFPVSVLTVVNLGLWSLLILSLIRRIK